MKSQSVSDYKGTKIFYKHVQSNGDNMLYHFTVVICNSKNEYLLGDISLPDDNRRLTFIGFDIEGIDLYEIEDINALIVSTVHDTVGIEICDLALIERFYSPKPRITHAIFTASISTGTPTRIFYNKLYWEKLSDIDPELLDIYGLQVITKLGECSYCQFINKKKEQLDVFFKNFFDLQEQNLSILEALADGETINTATYSLALKQELIHLRASFIENDKLKKNITIQNYLKLYGRDDLAVEVDEFLDINVRDGLSLRKMIKETVDKYIAHYDNPTADSKEIYSYCLFLFAYDSPLSIKKVIPYIQGFVMYLCTEMWYDAGELGVKMSERTDEARQILRQQREGIKNLLKQAIEIRSAQYNSNTTTD